MQLKCVKTKITKVEKSIKKHHTAYINEYIHMVVGIIDSYN